MATPKKPAGGAKAAGTTPTPTQAAAEAPPAAETPAAETPAAPTPEEIEAQTNEMAEILFRPVSSAVNAKIKAEQEAEAEKPAEGVEDLPQDDAPEGGEKDRSASVTLEPEKETPEPEPEPTAPKPAEERFVPGAMTAEQVAATAREAAREEIESREPEPEPATEVPHGTPADDGLSDACQDQLMVLNKMAAMNPVHKDLPARQRKFWKAEEEYRARWEQANAGQPFDSTAADHAEFYRKNEPFVPMRDFKAAERALIADEAEERAVTRLRKEQEPRLREIELKEREREAAPAIASSMADAAEEIFAAVPQFKEVFKPGKLSASDVEKMETINSLLADDAKEEAEYTAVIVSELERLTRLSEHYQVDYSKRHKLKSGKVFMPHVDLEEAAAETEAELIRTGERGGKKLITIAERDAQIKRIGHLKPEQRQREAQNLIARYDWMRPEDTRAHIISKTKARIAQKAERFAKMEKTPGKNTAANGVPPPVTTPKPATIVKPNGKANLARGTATTSSSDTSDNAPKSRSELEKTTEFLEKRLFR